jgi:hypothetical protein
MKKFLIGASALVLVFTVSKCTFNGPAAQAADWGCTNVWSGNTLTKTGKCNVTYGGTSTQLVQTFDPVTGKLAHQRKERQ